MRVTSAFHLAMISFGVPAGAMIPVKALISVKNVIGPEQIDRFNGFLAAKVLGNSAAGVSSGQAIAAVEDAAKSLPAGYTIAWTGQAFQEKRIGTQSIIAFTFAIIMAPANPAPASAG